MPSRGTSALLLLGLVRSAWHGALLSRSRDPAVGIVKITGWYSTTNYMYYRSFSAEYLNNYFQQRQLSRYTVFQNRSCEKLEREI